VTPQMTQLLEDIAAKKFQEKIVVQYLQVGLKTPQPQEWQCFNYFRCDVSSLDVVVQKKE